MHESDKRMRGSGKGTLLSFLALCVAAGALGLLNFAAAGSAWDEATGFLTLPLLWPGAIMLPGEADETIGRFASIVWAFVASLPWLAFLAWLGARLRDVQANKSFERTRSARRSTP